MKEQSSAQQVQQANLAAFGYDRLDLYAAGAPHLMHEPIMGSLCAMIKRAIDACPGPEIKVLDLGAGEGSVTRLWLSYNTKITAVDVSSAMLAELQSKCGVQSSRLRCVSMGVDEYLAKCDERFDIVSCISFLHHVPDYLQLIRLSLPLLTSSGVLLTFADPIRYDTLRPVERLFEQVAYSAWRLGRPDVLGGIQRRLHRKRGIYLDNSAYDNAEYHVTRNGVDQDAIIHILQSNEMLVELIRYWSTQSQLFQRIGSSLRFESNFAIFARKVEVQQP
jgi:SAM-dependent methyltransferase